jgi:hypothetical protein
VEEWLPYWPAMLWRSSRSVWALGFRSVLVTAAVGGSPEPMVVAS